MGDKLKGLLKKPIFWIAIAGVALFAIVRSRMSAQQGQDQGAAPAPFTGGGGGGGYNGPGAPNGSSIMDQIAQQDLAAETERIRQSNALFNFNLQQKQVAAGILEPLQRAWEKTQEALQGTQQAQAGLATATIGSEQGALKAKGLSCEGKGSFRIGIIPGSNPPQIGAFCREKTSGNFVTSGIQNIIQGVMQGVANVAPNAVQGYLGQQIGFLRGGIPQSPGQQAGEGQSQRQSQQPGQSPKQRYQVSGGSVTGISGGQFQLPGGLFPTA